MSNMYEDNTLLLDEAGITIKNYFWPGHTRAIQYSEISDTSLIQLGRLTGRHRLVGLGFRRPRHFFHWDRHRSQKTKAIALDIGKFLHPVITPDDAGQVLNLIAQRSPKPKLQPETSRTHPR